MQFKICELQLVPGKTLIIAGYFLQKKESVTSRAETYVSAHIYGKLPTYLEKARPIWRKHPFLGGNKFRNCPIFLYGPVTYTTGIFFFKKIDQNRSVLPLAVPKRFYTHLYVVATTNYRVPQKKPSFSRNGYGGYDVSILLGFYYFFGRFLVRLSESDHSEVISMASFFCAHSN